MAKFSDLAQSNKEAGRVSKIVTSFIKKRQALEVLRYPNISMPKIEPSPLITNMYDNYASEFYKQLKELVQEFDSSLNDSHEVGIRLVSFGKSLVFHLESMGYYNPSLIFFMGHTEKNEPVELIQHVSQISVLLMKLPRKNPNEPKKPIGFHAEMEHDSK